MGIPIASPIINSILIGSAEEYNRTEILTKHFRDDPH